MQAKWRISWTSRKKRCNHDPLPIACKAAAHWNAAVALKGAATFIALPDGRAWCHEGGNIGLAISGSGDVLAGIIAGLAARGASLEQAAAWGVALPRARRRATRRTAWTDWLSCARDQRRSAGPHACVGLGVGQRYRRSCIGSLKQRSRLSPSPLVGEGKGRGDASSSAALSAYAFSKIKW